MYPQSAAPPAYGQQPQQYGPQPYPYQAPQNYQDPQQSQGYYQYMNQQPQPYYNQYGVQQPYPYTPAPAPYVHPEVTPHRIPTFRFSDKSVRQAFIRKVYAILSVQMIVTIGIMCIFIFVDSVKEFVKKYPFLYLVALVIVIVLMIVLGCCTAPRRMFPLNYILLGIFTLAEGFLLGVISVKKDTAYVLYAGLITLAIVVSITIFALQTSIDFTYLTGAMLIVSIVFLAFGIIALIMQSKILHLIYCCIGVLVFSMFLLIDTQLMLGGDHAYSISPEDYVFAALNLYVDIVQIFLMVLGILSSSD